ncbi:MAG: M14 family zinc carboxypeptidase [Actinomycetes bacterium]
MRPVRALVTVALASTALLAVPAPAAATPVATDEERYQQCGRVFPDPQAYGGLPAQLPGESPWAKGNAECRAVDFIQYTEAVGGVEFLEQKFPRFVEVYNLREDFADLLADVPGGGQSAGLATPTLERDKSDLYMVRITDEASTKDKKLFLFTLSLHGIEKAGVEGGLRAAEDLATWAATDPDQPIMETEPDSLPVGQVLQDSEIWFAMNNPDGWRRGDTNQGGLAYQRYNGNGVDLNRDWPEKGFTFRPYTPASEPETASFAKVWKSISQKWDGGVDLHGQLIDRAFSFTLLGASQRPYGKNQRMLQFTQGAYEDAEERLSWNPLIKPNDAPPSCALDAPEPGCDPSARVYGVQYGSIWDTIAYTVTGAIGDWADSDLGLDADFIDNEMSLSHLSNCYTGKCFFPSAEQLHVDGNKSLIYAMVNYTLLPEDQSFRFTGRAAYLTQPERLSHPGSPTPAPPPALPPQDPIENQTITKGAGDATFEFDVLGHADGVHNGGLSAKLTFSNVQGISPNAVLTVAVERENTEEPEPGGTGWTTVNQDFNQSPVYLQAGMQVDANDITPGRYRIRLSGPTPARADADITFTTQKAWPDPGQLPYDVSNLDFFEELAPFAGDGKLTPVPAAEVAGGRDLSSFDTVVAVDRTLSDPAVARRLKTFAEQGGNVVLTDDALSGLADMGLVPEEAITVEDVYAGSVSFQADAGGSSDDTYEDPLAAGVHPAGSAEGPRHRKQTTEPVPIGYAIQDEDGGDASTLPQHGITPQAFTDAGGRVVGVVGDSDEGNVTYGEIPVGDGQVRVLGSLLPFPTDEYDHPFGLNDYSITFTAYEMAKNLLSWDRDTGSSGSPGTGTDGTPSQAGGTLPKTGADPAVPLAALLLVMTALAVRTRRVRRARR